MCAALRVIAPLLLALALAVATTALVAVGIARLATPPEAWTIFNDNMRAYQPGFDEFFEERPDDERLALLLGRAVGIQVFDLSFYDAHEYATAAHPPRVRRRLITEAGWPAPAMATESPRIGWRLLGKFADQGGPAPPDDGWRLMPRGFAFNSLLFTSLWLALLAVIRLPRRCCGLPAGATLCVCAGLWVSLGVAWAAYFLHDPGGYSFFTREAAHYESAVGPVVRPPHGVPWDSFEGGVAQRFGSRREQYHMGSIAVTESGVAYYAMIPVREYRFQLGWPLYCFDGDEYPFVPPLLHDAGAMFRVPVSWPGLFGNWAFYTAIALGLIYAPPWIRARRRLWRKCCPACGYPIGESPVCTECGMSLPASAFRTDNPRTASSCLRI